MGNESKESKATELAKLTNFFADKTEAAEKAAAPAATETEDAEKAAADMKAKEEAEKGFPEDLKDKKEDKGKDDKEAEKALLTSLVSLVEKSLVLQEKNASDIAALGERFTSHEKSLEVNTSFNVTTGRYLERIASVAGSTASTVTAIAQTTQPRATADAPVAVEKSVSKSYDAKALDSYVFEHFSNNIPLQIGIMDAAEKGNFSFMDIYGIPNDVVKLEGK